MDKDLLACLMAAFPDEIETASRRDSCDYLTIRGYRVAYDAGADPDILDLLSALQPGPCRLAQGMISTIV
jgi:hypothetical protein